MCVCALALSALQTYTDTDANSVDPWDGLLSTLFAIIFCLLSTLFAVVDMYEFKDGRVHFRDLGMKELTASRQIPRKMLDQVWVSASSSGHRHF